MKQNSLKIFMETETWTEFKMLLKQVDALALPRHGRIARHKIVPFSN